MAKLKSVHRKAGFIHSELKKDVRLCLASLNYTNGIICDADERAPAASAKVNRRIT